MTDIDKALDDLIDKAYARYLREMRQDGISGLRDYCRDDDRGICVDCPRNDPQAQEEEKEVKENG